MNPEIEDIVAEIIKNKRTWEKFAKGKKQLSEQQEVDKGNAIKEERHQNYKRSKPWCDSCICHLCEEWEIKCNNPAKAGHNAKSGGNTQATSELGRVVNITCFSCGKKGHFRSVCKGQ